MQLNVGTMRSIIRSAVFILIFALVIAMLHMWVKNKSYVFDQGTIFDITRKAIAKFNATGKATHSQIFDEVAKALEAKYPSYIIPKSDRGWLFVNYGGVMASFYLLHASTSEYIYFMGSAMHTSGHAGRHWLNISDIVVGGEYREWPEGTTRSVIHYPGQTTFLMWGTTAGMEWIPGTWIVEYGRGIPVPSMIFVIVDTLTATADVYNLYKISLMWGKAILRSLLNFTL